MKCNFPISIHGKECGAPAAYRKHTTVKSTIKGQPHQWSPPDEFYCDRHCEIARRGQHLDAPGITKEFSKL